MAVKFLPVFKLWHLELTDTNRFLYRYLSLHLLHAALLFIISFASQYVFVAGLAINNDLVDLKPGYGLILHFEFPVIPLFSKLER